MIKLQVIGARFSELIPMATISPFDFTPMELTQQQDNLQPSSSPFSLETTTVFCDGHFLKLFISVFGTSLIRSIRGRKRSNPLKNYPLDDRHLLSRMMHSLLPSTSISHIPNSSAKLMATL